MSKKLVTGFAQIFVCGIRIYLFGSYLRFKSLYMFLGIKLYDTPLNLQNAPLKFKISVLKIKANPNKLDWLILSYGLFIFLSTPYRRCKSKKLWAKNLHHFFKNVVAIFNTN